MNPASQAIDLERARIDPAWALRIPVSLALRRMVLPFAAIEGHVYVACLDPRDSATLEAVQRFTRHPVVPVLAERAALQRSLVRVYGEGGGTQPALRTDLADLTADDAVTLADELIRAAILRQASDIHLDPGREQVWIRFRVDGVLEEYQRLPNTILASLTSRIKVLAGMDIAERRAPQDGAFTYRFGTAETGQAIDIRVASLPTRHGERVTLRLLAAQDNRLTLDRLGLCPEDLAIMERVLAKPHGLVLLTGPTGSGKSTTLYAAIQKLRATSSLNILTVEDPIEYEMAGVGQAEVDSADKVSFRKALRSLLRHDPDVIMIGEIRDAESLDIAVKASLTGHLVLSTLHTNDAPGVIPRLLDMGTPPHLLGATVRLCVAQRLVRRLCPECRVPRVLDAARCEALGRPELAGQTVYEPGQCLYCAGRGYSGRMGLFECAVHDVEIAALVASGARHEEYRAALRRKRFRTLMEDAVAKVLAGETTVAEVIEVTTDL